MLKQGLLACVLLCAGSSALADVIYSNFDPTAVTPDYGPGASSLSSYCANFFCTWINTESVDLQFTAQATGTAVTAYVPMAQPYWMTSGANTIHVMYFYDLTNPNIPVACAGLSNNGPLAANVATPAVEGMVIRPYANVGFDPWCDSSLGAGYTFQAGQSYLASFNTIFGAVNNTYWYDSTVLAAPGDAQQGCRVVTGGSCGWGPVDLPYLPALTLTDANGYTAPVAAVSEPTGMLWLLAGVLGLHQGRRRRHSAVGRVTSAG